MSRADASKRCIVCGEDCSDRPRVRNAKGQYACKSCLEAKRSERPPIAVAPPDTDNHRIAALAELEQAVADTPVVGSHCPGCGKRVGPTQVICLGCGYDLVKGEERTIRVKEVKVRPPVVKPTGARLAFAVGVATAGAAIGLGVWAAASAASGLSLHAMSLVVGALAGFGGAIAARGYGTTTLGGAAALATTGAVIAGVALAPGDQIDGFEYDPGGPFEPYEVVALDESQRALFPMAWTLFAACAAFGLASTNHEEEPGDDDGGDA